MCYGFKQSVIKIVLCNNVAQYATNSGVPLRSKHLSSKVKKEGRSMWNVCTKSKTIPLLWEAARGFLSPVNNIELFRRYTQVDFQFRL